MSFFSFEYFSTGLDFRFPMVVMEKYNEIKAGGDFLEVQGGNCSCMAFALTWLLFCFNFSTVLLENALFAGECMIGFRRYTWLRFQKYIFFQFLTASGAGLSKAGTPTVEAR